MMKKDALNPLKLLAMLSMAFGLVLFTGCGEDDPDDGPDDEPTGPTETVLGVLQSTAGLDSMARYIGLYPDLESYLETQDGITLFAPDNAAFITLMGLIGTEDITFVNPDLIKGVISYHIVSTQYDELTDGDEIGTLQGEPIVVNPGGTLFTGATNKAIEISETEAATNGVLHILKSVIIPPSVGAQLVELLGTNAGTVFLGADFSNMAYAVQSADTFATINGMPPVLSFLAGEDKHTFFATHNDVFAGQSMTGASFTGEQWYGILMNSLILTQTSEEDYGHTETWETAGGGTLMFLEGDPGELSPIGLYIDSNGDQTPDAGILSVDNPALISSNGTVQVIAGFLSPQ